MDHSEIISIIVLTILPNNKAIIAWLLLSGLIFSIKYKNLTLGFFLTLLPALLLTIGKWYSVEAIPARFMESSLFAGGYRVGWGITPTLVLLPILILLIIRNEYGEMREYLKNLPSRIKTSLLLFGGYAILASIANQNSPFPLVSWVHLSYQLCLPILMIVTSYMLTSRSIAKKVIGRQLWIVLIWQTVLGMSQLISHTTLGFAIESAQFNTSSSGIDQLPLFRPLGTLTNPNQFGLITYILWTSILILWKQKNKWLTLIGVWNSIFCLSRSLWLGLTLPLIRTFMKARKTVSWNAITIIPLIFFVFVIGARLVVTTRAFEQYGGVTDRVKLLTEAIVVIQDHPLQGTGINTNEISLFRENPKGVITYFPTAVHNAYVQIAIDAGIPSLLCFIVAIYYATQKSHRETVLVTAVFYLFQPHIDFIDFPLMGLLLGVSLSTLQSRHAIKTV